MAATLRAPSELAVVRKTALVEQPEKTLVELGAGWIVKSGSILDHRYSMDEAWKRASIPRRSYPWSVPLWA